MPQRAYERLQLFEEGKIDIARGATTEGVFPETRRESGEIRDYVMNRHASDSRGYPSDDTQLSFWTLEQLNKDGGCVPENVAKCLYRNRIHGIGRNVTNFIANHKAGKPWYEAGPKSAGNGALMRIAPMLIPHFKSPSPELWVDTALSAMITHNDSASIEACQGWYSSVYLMETVPSALYILMKHGDDLEEAVVRAVNDTMDNDTVAAIVGAAVGALYGKKAIPGRWLDNLSGCTRIEDGEVLDEGQVHKVLDESQRLWG